MYQHCNMVSLQTINSKEFKEPSRAMVEYMSVRWYQIKSGKYIGKGRSIPMDFTTLDGLKIPV